MDSIGQDKVFRSKIGFVIFLPLIIVAGIAFTIWYGDRLLLAPTLLLGFIALFIFSFFNTAYTITADHLLKIKCSVIINMEIDINTISKITKTLSALSSPALSFDRIEIHYNKYDSVIVSPKNKAEFIARLKTINPAIDTFQFEKSKN